jgi:hypothetical protein
VDNKDQIAEAARRLLALRADEQTQLRVDDLANRNTEGQLTPEELAEYESIVNAAELLAILQAKARAWLESQ